ncbi:MAG: histidine phosphatase family protein [Spirochaetales bacterium]|nr:histidine phosphatase family protein [Spirochaetales bacterium]
MNNRYYALRHGRSEANEAGKIVSSPEEGTRLWGLTETGRKQVADGIGRSGLGEETVIVTSDFRRTRETARLAAELLHCPEPEEDARLRERFFGDYDGKDNSHYERIWEKDVKNGHNKEGNVESPEEVRHRVSRLVMELEERFHDRDIILVSHGDALQIGQTWFEQRDSREHRDLAHLETGEVRRLADR